MKEDGGLRVHRAHFPLFACLPHQNWKKGMKEMPDQTLKSRLKISDWEGTESTWKLKTVKEIVCQSFLYGLSIQGYIQKNHQARGIQIKGKN